MFALQLALLQDPQQMQQAQKLVLGMLAVMPFFILLGIAIVMIPIWFICKKAGFSPWLSLLVVVPFGGLILLYVLAFGEWKVIPAPQLAAPTYYPPLPPTPPRV